MKNIFLIFSLILLVSCGSKEVQNEPVSETTVNTVTLNEAQMKSAGIIIGTSEMKSISTLIKVNGKIDVPPQNMISVSMPLGGYLRTTQLLAGMHVKKGEVIATMEDLRYIELQQEYLSAKSKVVYFETEYERQKDLNESKASSDKVFQQAKMDYEMQKITVNALAEKLKLINVDPKSLSENNLSKSVSIYSPIDGFVSKVNVNIGKYVNPSDILFELVNPSDIHLNLKVFEKDLEKLFIGQKLVAYNNNEPDKKHPCEIILISQYVSPERTSEVHCHFEDYDKTLYPGMYMNADIEVRAAQTNAVGEESIVNFGNRDYVFVAKGNNTFELTEIKKGATENKFTEISFENGGKVSETKIVTHGAYSLLMQLKNTGE
jgi:membrane fusion protein, heavy metal efflux system